MNVASRIEPLAEDGGVCLTRQVYDHVQNKFELPLTSLGTRQLKNVVPLVEIYKIVMPWAEDQGTSSIADKRRIAVLPFANMSPNSADEYFADGMTEELIASLAGLRGLTVIARTSVMRYRSTSKSVSEIGRELNVGTLIEGSVRKADSRVRITVQLIDTRDEGHIWAQNYDKQLDDIFAVQSDIAERVARELRIRLIESEKQRLEDKPTKSTEAYALYLKGRYYWNERSETGIRSAIEYFNEAIRIDPAFAFGYSGLADCYFVVTHNALAEFGPNYQRAKEYAKRALELDENLAEAHAAFAGVLENYDHDWKAAESEYRHAIELKPSYASAHQWYAIFIGRQGRLAEASKEIRRALELDPLSMVINVNIGDSFYYDKEYDKAIEQYERVIEMDPSFANTYFSVVPSYVRSGEYDEALKAGEKFARLTGRPSLGKTVDRLRVCVDGEEGRSGKTSQGIRGRLQERTPEPILRGPRVFPDGRQRLGV